MTTNNGMDIKNNLIIMVKKKFNQKANYNESVFYYSIEDTYVYADYCPNIV